MDKKMRRAKAMNGKDKQDETEKLIVSFQAACTVRHLFFF